MKIALAHLELSVSGEIKNKEKLEKAIQIAGCAGADWLLTPETALQGYFFHKIQPIIQAPVQPSQRASKLAKEAAAYQMNLFLCCGEYEKQLQKNFNSCLVFDKQGEVIGRHRKIISHGVGAEAWAARSRDIQPILCDGIQAGVMDTGSAAEVILKESDRMTELVDELLDISKIDMGRQPLALSEMDVRELLYDSIRAVEPAAAGGGIAITPDFPETPVMVSCDDTRLRRAVTNILSNGVRYAHSQLHLTCRTEKRHVTIRIQDDGDGIAAEDLPHIFDRFYMGKNGKSGIGLALAKEIIHLHKGTIRAYNGDSGAVFEISIPVSR